MTLEEDMGNLLGGLAPSSALKSRSTLAEKLRHYPSRSCDSSGTAVADCRQEPLQRITSEPGLEGKPQKLVCKVKHLLSHADLPTKDWSKGQQSQVSHRRTQTLAQC